jgi:transposase
MLDIREMIRRFRMGHGDRQIARDLGAGRNTVKSYRVWAKAQGFLDCAELPELGVIEEHFKATYREPVCGPASSVEPHREFVKDMRAKKVEMVALLNLLRERGYKGSYSSLRRFVSKLEPKRPEAFVRVETKPGKEAQVDFGYAGKLYDPVQKRERRAWAFVMTLSFSRHIFSELVFDQKVETWCALHVRAFEFFGGVVETVVIDNLKAAVTKALVHDPQVQRSYRELAEHYGFAISPCRPVTPRHKGKCESGVHYVKRNALAGRTFLDINAGNAHLLRWSMETAGLRLHGTTHERPLDRFRNVEQAALKPLPRDRFEVVTWKEVKLHPDCHVVFEYNYYSAPFRLVGETLWLRATGTRVELYREHERLTSHPRAIGRGQRMTVADHLPPEKIQNAQPHQEHLRAWAGQIGPSTTEVIERLLGDRPLDRLRTAQAILNFAKRVGEKRLEAACKRALTFDEVRYYAIRNILRKGLDAEPLPQDSAPAPLPTTSTFARTAAEMLPPKRTF